MVERIEYQDEGYAGRVDFMPRVLPDDEGLDIEEVLVNYPSRTQRLDIKRGWIRGFTDGIEALSQAVYKKLLTPAGVYPIYSEHYGLPVDDLIGLDHHFVESELKNRITETMLLDERIAAVEDFHFTKKGDALTVRFCLRGQNGEKNYVEGRLEIA
ncbi:MAG: DUF2634 domain-containing protein [Bacillota bacterium]|jgi:hypothetical protein